MHCLDSLAGWLGAGNLTPWTAAAQANPAWRSTTGDPAYTAAYLGSHYIRCGIGGHARADLANETLMSNCASGCKCRDASFGANPGVQNGGIPGNMAECFGALDGDGGLTGLQLKVSNDPDSPHCLRFYSEQEFRAGGTAAMRAEATRCQGHVTHDRTGQNSQNNTHRK